MNTTPKIYKMRIAFTVAGIWDHKRILSALRQMVLRSGLPFEPAKVNKNWPRLAYGPVLGYGQYSLGEIADLYFSTALETTQVQSVLEKSAPDGVRILRVWRVPYALPSVSNLADVMQYSVQGDFSFYTPACCAEEFFRKTHVYVTVEALSGMNMQQDLKPFILRAEQPQPDRVELFLQKCGDKTTKPEYVIAAWLQIPVPAQEEFTLPKFKFTREALYWRDSAAALHAL